MTFLFYRQFCSVFSLKDVLEMDLLVSSFLVLGTKEAGPLVLAWAVFVCLLLSLPERTECTFIGVYGQFDMCICVLRYTVCMYIKTHFVSFQEIDHIAYLRQAFEAAPFNYILEILRSDAFRESDVSLLYIVSPNCHLPSDLAILSQVFILFFLL